MFRSFKGKYNNSKAEVIDISTWDLSDAKDLDDMFKGAAVKRLYVRTQKDAEIIKNSKGFPDNVEVIPEIE